MAGADAVLDWENSRESNNAQTAEQHPENGIDTNVYYTAIEDAYFGMKNSDAHDVWLSYKSNYRYYYNHDAAAGTALTVEQIPAITLCEDCGQQYPTVPHGRTCPHCQSPHTHLLQGNEMMIKEVEAVEPETSEASG